MEMLHFQRLLPPTSLVGWPFSDHRSPLWGFPGSRPWVKNGDERSRYWEKKAGPIGVIPTELREPTFWQPSHIYICRYMRIYIYMKLYIMQVNKTCINTQLKHARSCSRQMKDIFSCWKSARLPLIFGNYIFGNYSFGKYFLSLQYRTWFRLKKKPGYFHDHRRPMRKFRSPWHGTVLYGLHHTGCGRFMVRSAWGNTWNRKKNRAMNDRGIPDSPSDGTKKTEEKINKISTHPHQKVAPSFPTKKEKKVDPWGLHERCVF